MSKLNLFACTTVGGAKHLREWFAAVKKLEPSMIVTARDLSRNESIPNDLEMKVLNHDSRKKWLDYKHRKDDLGDAESLVNGVRMLMRAFLKSKCTHFFHLDSDQILDHEAIEQIKPLNWDYMQFTMVALPSNITREHHVDWLRFLDLFWESMCFGLSRALVRRAFKDLKSFTVDPTKPDIQVHQILRKHFKSLKKGKKILIETPNLIHYIEGEAITLSKAAIIKRWRKQIKDNKKFNRAWFHGFPYRWWWGKSDTKFFSLFPSHLNKTEPKWFTENELKRLRRTKPKWFAPTGFLMIVDVYGWAWDIASRELLQAMPDIKGRVLSMDDFNVGAVDPKNYDVVLAYPWAASGFLNRLNRRNTVICVAGGEQLDLINSFRDKCGRFKFYGACNKKIRVALKKRFPKKKVFLLSHGVDKNLFKPSVKKKRKSFIIGWVGRRDRPLKRFKLAKNIAKKAGVKLSVAGFMSRSHRKMPRFYNSTDCLLVTSMTEAHPLVVYEAMSCGLPVVSTKVGDVDEFIVNGKNGFVLPVNAPVSSFVKVINRLKKNPKLRKRIGNEARRTILKKLTWRKVAKQYRALMKFVR